MARWSDQSGNPNSRVALNYRSSQLEGRARVLSQSRLELLRQLAQGKRVLDVGCVDHDFNARDELWLHGKLASVAKDLVGVDSDSVGVTQMRAAGYNVVHADVEGDVTALVELGPFELVVAGEVIEHMNSPLALLQFGRRVLSPDGFLIVTTPNPYAPWRMRNGQRGIVWENVDHVLYAFPAGMVELADRAGLQLEWYGAVDATGGRPAFVPAVIAQLRAAFLRQPIRPWHPSVLDVLLMKVRRGPMLLEQAVYCLARPQISESVLDAAAVP